MAGESVKRKVIVAKLLRRRDLPSSENSIEDERELSSLL